MLNNASNLYNNELTLEYKKAYEREPKDDKSYGWEQKYSPNNLKALNYQSVRLETKPLSDDNRSGVKQLTQVKLLKLNEISKPLWIKLTRKDFYSLIKDVVNNLDNEHYKTIASGKKYDLKNAEKFLLEVINKKSTENEARELNNNLIKPDIFELEKSTSRSKDKSNNFLNILSNLESVFTGLYFHLSR